MSIEQHEPDLSGQAEQPQAVSPHSDGEDSGQRELDGQRSGSLDADKPTAGPSQGLKKQVNYRLNIDMIEGVQRASIEFSYRQGRKFSQNMIVELALREWLERNGPWGR
ncbi:hypothetical protein [Mycolicibacterium sp.]|uniref:hypothetical protein n=1 Tax=Mycolicibacterium sp. TaxID=2320850 RepID=UPI0037CB933E